MTKKFDVIVWWDEQFPGTKILKKKAKLKPVLHFSLMWNYFEHSFAPNYRRPIGTCLRNFGEKSFPMIGNNEVYQNTLIFFRKRYLTKRNSFNAAFENLQLSNDNKLFVEKCLLGEKSDDENFVAILLIIYRFRNNLFHGEKFPNTLNTYEKPFKTINEFLATCIEKLKDNIWIDSRGEIICRNGMGNRR